MYRWLNELSQQFLERDYLLPGQTVDDRVTIITNTISKILNRPDIGLKFHEYMKNGWYSLSTPIWTNFGTDRGLPISCFGSYIDDSMESIAHTWAEVSMMTKCGGGTSAYFGNLRPRGSTIKNNGESAGSVHFMQAFDTLVNIISQGKTRRGNFAAYLPIDHPDIMEFLQIRDEGFPIQDLSYGVCVPDDWMESMIDGDSSKRKVWAKVLESRSNKGFPYLFFTGNVNRHKPVWYKDLPITHSNLCVTGDQLVVSNFGLVTAKQLYESHKELQLFDNNKIVKSTSMKLIEKNANTFKIQLDNGMSHSITDYHHVAVLVKNKRGQDSLITKACKDLKIGDRVAVQTNKGLFGQIDKPDEAFLLGLYQADGTQYKDTIMLDIWENDFDLEQEIQDKFNQIHNKYSINRIKNKNQYPIQFHECVVSTGTVRKRRLSSKTLQRTLQFKKGEIPYWVLMGNEKTQWEYVRGLLYADGTVFLSQSAGNPIQISLANINRSFLEKLQVIFANLGLQTSIRLLREAGPQLLPDGKGGKKFYHSKDCWRLIIGNKNDALTIEKNTGFLSRKNVYIEDRQYRDNTKKAYEITSIDFIGKQDVYCCTVDSPEHLWVCNGVLTHNCTEIFEPDSSDESFVCDLASMNMVYYDEWKNTDAVETLVYVLDAVMTEFIEKARHIRFMERAVKFAERHRAIGIGWIGWHTLLQKKSLPFESMEAKYLNTEIAKLMFEKTDKASRDLAKEFGECDVCKGHGRRNALLLAIAPTKSSSFILGQPSEAVEPYRTNVEIKDLAKGKFTLKNPQLEEVLEKYGKNNDETWTTILKSGGSIQHLDFLSDHEKNVFKTFAEISPKEIIIQASQRQKYIDQGQSLNLMIHPSTPTKDVNALIIEAWKLGIKSLYYQISVNAAQEFSRSILNCTNCES